MEDLKKVHDAPPNTFWDEAQNLYNTSIGGLESTHGLLVQHVQNVMSDPESRKQIKDEAALAANLNLLAKDIKTHVDLLNQIHETHKDKTGGTQTPDEHMAILNIHGQYAEAIELYQTVITPTVAHIFELTGVSDDLVSQQIADTLKHEEDATNPNIVTDVQVKENK